MKRNCLTVILSAISFFFASLGQGIIFHSSKNKTEQNQANEKHLELAKDEAFLAVGKLELAFINDNTSEKIRAFCTGTLIDPRTVLTSADCIEPLIKSSGFRLHHGELDEDNTFTLGNDVYSEPLAQQKILSASFFPSFVANMEGMEARNLALLFLKEPIRNVKPAQLFDKHKIENNLNALINDEVVMVGFGFYGDPQNGINNRIDYKKRACLQKIKSYQRSMFTSRFGIESEEMHGMFTHGDQGGPIFIKQDGTFVLLAVNAFRKISELEQASEKVKADPRYLPYGTTGYSLAVPCYEKWLKNNKGLKKISRADFSEKSEWDFDVFWKPQLKPNNEIGSYYEVLLNQPNAVLVNKFFTVDKLVINNNNAQLIVPKAVETAWDEIELEEQITKLLKEDKKFEAVEYSRTFFKIPKAQKMHRLLQFKSDEIILKQGHMRIDGELSFNRLAIKGGRLSGFGELIHSEIPVRNSGGIVAPFDPEKAAKLIMWGDYHQLDEGEKNLGGSLKIRVIKTKKAKKEILTNDVLVVKGQTQLGGTLIIKEIGEPIIEGDEISFLHSPKILGRFSKIEVPTHLKAELIYNEQSIKIIFHDLGTSIEVNEKQKLILPKPQSFKSFKIAGGQVFATKAIKLLDGASLVLESGELNILPGDENNVLEINGNYEQQEGSLNIRFYKELVEKISVSKFYKQSDETLIEFTPEMATKPHDKSRIIEVPVKNPEFIYKNDLCRISGQAILAGKLKLSFDDEPIIQAGAEFTLLEAQKINGQFEEIESLETSLSPSLIYTPTSVKIRFDAKGYSSIEFKDERAKKVAIILDTIRNQPKWKEKFALLYRKLDSMEQVQVEGFILGFILNTPGMKKLMSSEEFRNLPVE